MHPVRSVITAAALALLLQTNQAQATDASLVGHVYPAELAGAAAAFTLQRSTETTGDTSVLTERFEDMEGHAAALLTSTYVSGALRSITFEQRQTKESASAVFRQGRVFFTTTENGNTRTSDQAVDGTWVPLSAVPEEITAHWDGLTGGEAVKFVMPVPIMRDHFAFEVTRQRSWRQDGRQRTEFRMQASSLLIRMMADAFYYVFDDDSRTLIEYRGVTIAKAVDNGKLKDLKARITYAPVALASPGGH